MNTTLQGHVVQTASGEKKTRINIQSSKGEIDSLNVCKIRDAGEVIIQYVQNQSLEEDMQTLWHVTEGTQDKNILQ